MKRLEMNNGDQYDFAGLQRAWKSDEESFGIANLQSRVRKEIASRTKFRRGRLFLVASFWITGLLIMATYRHYQHGNLGVLGLGFSLLVFAGWLGTASSGPEPLSALPHNYLRTISSGKEQQLKRTGVAQLIAIFAFVVSLLAIWFASGGRLQRTSWQEESLPIGVLLLTLATIGGLIALRGSRRKELAYLRELERQFKLFNEQLAGPTHDRGNDGDQ